MLSANKEATKPQIGIIGTICSRLKISPDVKETMVSSFSDGRETSSKNLNFAEADAMIKYLKSIEPVDHSGDKMIGKIFYYAHEMGWTKINRQGKKVADGQRVDKWMQEYSYLKKKLNKYTYAELPKLVSQFEQVYKHHLNKF